MIDKEFEAFEAKCMAEEIGLTQAEKTERELEVIETEILFYKQQAGTAILEIGARLIEAKRQLNHGEWEAWLTEKVDFSVRSAQRFMKLAEGYSKSDTVTLLGTRKALALLALEESEREEFLDEKHVVNGEEKSAEEMTAAELEQAIRERNEARLALEQAEADRKTAEAARTRMEAEMLLAKNRMDDLEQQMKRKEADANRKAAAAEARAELLREELEELRNRPVEVAVESDEEELDAAYQRGKEAGRELAVQDAKADREAAVAEVQKKLDAALKEKKEAEAAAKDVRRKLKEAQEKGQTEADALRSELDKLRKTSALAGDKDMVEFNAYFKAAQEDINRMAGVLVRVRSAGKDELAQKLAGAIQAMAEAVRKAGE